jgi:CPA2 family monovalent cation:H+ antiporter-2
MVEEFLKSLVVIFGLSAFIVYLLHKVKLPSIVGFLLSGIIIGPYGIGLVKDVQVIEIFAEIGIILLLFVLGIELSLSGLFEMRRFLFIAGGLQVVITSLLVFSAALNFLNLKTSIFVAIAIASSSTAVGLKYLVDKGEIDAPHGKVIVGISIFQDLLAVFVTTFIPIFSGEVPEFKELIFEILLSVLFVIVIVWGSRKIVPSLLFQVVKSRVRDLFIISILFLCFSVALIASEFGLSLAFGAFLAGLLISESEYAHQVTADIIPFRESLMALFFISVGMLFKVGLIVENLIPIIFASLLIMLIKIIGTFASVTLAGDGFRVSLISAFALSQISEFSLVLISLGKKHGIIPDDFYDFFIGSFVLTMMFSSILLIFTNKITFLAERYMKIKDKVFEGAPINDELKNHVIIVGFGLNGRNIAKALKTIRIPYVVLELNIITVKKMRELGEPIYYGDGTSVDVLRKVGIDKAKMLVVVISDPTSTRKIVSLARSENPHIYIIVRTRFVSEVEELRKLGADEVIPEEFETSIEISSRVLKYFNLPLNLVREYVSKLREDAYKVLRRFEMQVEKVISGVDVLKHLDSGIYIVSEASLARGKSIAELNLKSETGAMIIAVQREGEIFTNPSSDFVFKVGDVMFIIGKREEIERAIEFLEGEK